jgi:hypothetical protein
MRVVVASGRTWIDNVTRGERVAGSPLPPIMLEILELGGIVGFLAKRGGWT